MSQESTVGRLSAREESLWLICPDDIGVRNPKLRMPTPGESRVWRDSSPRRRPAITRWSCETVQPLWACVSSRSWLGRIATQNVPPRMGDGGQVLNADHASRLMLRPKRPYKSRFSSCISSRSSCKFSSSDETSALILSTD